MALPRIMVRLFDNLGFGSLLRKDIIPPHADTHENNGKDRMVLDASQVVSGIFSLDRIPESAKDRLVKVPDLESMFKLTKDEAQNGDFVLVEDNGLWYGICDDEHLDSIEGYAPIGATKTAEKLATPIRVKLTGVNGESILWDGSSNLEIPVTSIDRDLLISALDNVNTEILNPKPKFSVIYLDSDSVVNKDYSSKVICSDGYKIVFDSTDMPNGWNCYIKNTSSDTKCLITSNDNSTIDNNEAFELLSLMTVHLFFDGENNFVSVDTTPRVTIN